MLNILRRNSILRSLVLQLAVAFPLSFCARAAHAHISVEGGGTHKARFSDDSLKESPCGMAGGKRGTNVYNYKPGATITVSIVETIPHPGYFRIAFDNDGDDGFMIPAGTDGMSGNCSGDAKCGAGKEDYCNSDSVLLDRLDQHAAGTFGDQKKYTWSVTLPNVECDNCTLQIIQIMNDLNLHPQPFPADDIYYQCIDIKLSNDAPDAPATTPVMNNGMVCKGGSPSAGAAGDASGASAGSSGAPIAAGSSAAAGPTAQAGSTASAAGVGGSGAAMSIAAAGGKPASTASAGPPASQVTATTSTPAAGGAGKGAPGTGAAGTGSIASPSTNAGSGGASKPSSAPPASSGGCQATSGSANGLFGPLLLGLVAFGFRSRRRHRAM